MKIFKPLCILLCLVILCGCQTPSGPSQPDKDISFPSDSTRLSVFVSDDIVPKALNISLESLPGHTHGVVSYYQDRLLIETWSNNPEQLLYHEYTIPSNVITLLGTTPPLGYGGGTTVTTKEGISYTAFSFKGENQSTFIKIDPLNNRVRQLQKWNSFPPLQYFHITDENELLIFMPEQSASGDYYSYFIKKYTPSTAKLQTIVQKPDSREGGISSVDYANGKLYTYQFAKATNGYTNFIQCYYPDGQEAERYPIDPSAYLSEKEAFFRINVSGNLILLRSNLGKFIILHETKDGLKKTEFPGIENLVLFSSASATPDEYDCFYNQEKHLLIRYDAEKNAYVMQKVHLESNDLSVGFLINESGDIIMYSLDDSKEPPTYRFFSIPPLESSATDI